MNRSSRVDLLEAKGVLDIELNVLRGLALVFCTFEDLGLTLRKPFPVLRLAETTQTPRI